jgi:anthranilate phosphoribosyltransferase
VLQLLGDERAFVVHGAGIDELPLDGTGVLYDVTPDAIERREIVATDFGLGAAETSALAGGTPEENAHLIDAVLSGEAGPRRDVVLLNAGAALTVAGRTPTIEDGIRLAVSTIDSGAARALLERLRAEKQVADRERAALEGAPA